MSDTIIKVEGLGKKYIINHEGQEKYTALRDVISRKAKGFLKKDIDPGELKYALKSVMQSGYYYSTQTAGRIANLFRNNIRDSAKLENAMLDDKEVQFLRLVCTDLTYKEIAQNMSLTPRTVDAMRDHLFFKLDVKSRVGLAMVAIKNGVVNFSS